jgi:hypothetical protein
LQNFVTEAVAPSWGSSARLWLLKTRHRKTNPGINPHRLQLLNRDKELKTELAFLSSSWEA